MKQILSLSVGTVLLFFSINSQGQDYQVLSLDRDEKELLQRPENDELKNQLYCHGEEHIEEYSQFINTQIKPRLRNEIPQTTEVHRDQEGRLLKMADHISTGDLFHAHLRVPIEGFHSDHQKLAPRFMDPQSFHIQYHSFETYDLFTSDWKRELLQINNQNLRSWLDEVQAYQDEKASMGDPAFGSFQPEIESNLQELTNNELESFALAWFEFQHTRTPSEVELDQWLLVRLKNKLEMIDPKNLTGGSEIILRDRSFFTQNQKFHIIPGLNLEGYIQFANIYFAPVAPVPGAQELLDEARQAGINILYNVNSERFPHENFQYIENSPLHSSLMSSLFEKFSAMNDPHYVFHEKTKRTFDQSAFLAFMWDDKYIYAVRYSLLCD